MVLAALLAAQAIAASLSVGVADGSQDLVRITQDSDTGYRLNMDCVRRCVRPMHYAAAIADSPMGLIDLDRAGLIYSVWGTGCCYVVRVWKVTPIGVMKIFETGSRSFPSLITNPTLTVITYMRPTDARGRERSLSAQAIRWSYRHGRFLRS